MVPILDFTGLNACIILSLVLKILAQFKKFRKFPIKSYKIRTGSPILISAKLKNQNAHMILSTIMRNNFFFRKIQNFIKSERFEGFFSNSIPSVLDY